MAEKAFKVPSLELVGGVYTLTANSDSLIWGEDLLATDSYVDSAIANLVNSAPATLDTLNELAAALGDDANFATSIANSIAAKQDALTAGDYIGLSNSVISVDVASLSNAIAGSGLDALMGGTINVNYGEVSTALAGFGLSKSSNQLAVNTNVIATQAYVDSAVAGVDINVEALAGYGLLYDAVNDALEVDTGIMAKQTYVDSKVENAAGFGLTYDVNVSQFSIDTNVIASKSYVDFEIAALVNSAPATLDTLNELAAALGDDANFATSIANSIAAKQDALIEGSHIDIANSVVSVDTSTLVNAIAGYSLSSAGSTLAVDFNVASTALAGFGLTASGNQLEVNTSLIATQAYVDSAVAGVDINVEALAGYGLLYDAVNDALEVDTGIMAKQTYVDSKVEYLAGTHLTFDVNTQTLNVSPDTLVNVIAGYSLLAAGSSIAVDFSVASTALAGFGLTASGNQLEVNTSLIATQAYVDTGIDNLKISRGFTVLETSSYGNVDSFSVPAPMAVEYVVTMQRGTDTRVSKVLINAGSSDSNMTEYGIIENGSTLPGADITINQSGNTVILQAKVTDASVPDPVEVRFQRVIATY